MQRKVHPESQVFQKQSIEIGLSSVLMRVWADAKFNNYKNLHIMTHQQMLHPFFLIRSILNKNKAQICPKIKNNYM